MNPFLKTEYIMRLCVPDTGLILVIRHQIEDAAKKVNGIKKFIELHKIPE